MKDEILKNYYTINTLILMIFIFIFAVSEFMINFVSGMFGFLLYVDWIMIFLMLLAFMRFKGHIQQNVRNFFIVLMALPVMRIITFIFPFPEIDAVYRIIIFYGLLLVMSAIYIINLKVDIRKMMGTHFFVYLPITGLVIAGLSFVLYLVARPIHSLPLPSDVIYISSALLAVFLVSAANTIYFRALLQNLGEKAMDPTSTILLISALSVILFMGFRSIWIFIFMIMISSIMGIVFHETKNIYIIGVSEVIFNLTYLVIFPTLL